MFIFSIYPFFSFPVYTYIYINYECGKYMKCDVNAYGGRDDKAK